MYFPWVRFAERVLACKLRQSHVWKVLRETLRPTAVPRPMGRRIDAADFSRMKPGIVIDGTYVVISAEQEAVLEGKSE